MPRGCLCADLLRHLYPVTLPCFARLLASEDKPLCRVLFQEKPMAVQQNKKSPSKRGMHRSHNAVAAPGTGIEPTTGEVHLRHHISPTGFYRGRKVLKSKADA